MVFSSKTGVTSCALIRDCLIVMYIYVKSIIVSHMFFKKQQFLL